MLKRYVYIPKLVFSFGLAIASWTLLGVALNLILFFGYARHQVFVSCELKQLFGGPCGWAVLKTLTFLAVFPVLYLIAGKMWALSKVIKVLIEQHSEDFIFLMRPLLMKTAATVDNNVNPKAIKGVKGINDKIDNAPWLIGYIFKSLKGDFVQSVIEGKVDLKSEADVDAAMGKALREYSAEKRTEVKWIGGGLVALNLLGYFLVLR